MLLEKVEQAGDQGPKTLEWILDLDQRAQGFTNPDTTVVEDRLEDVFFAGEVVVERAGGDAGLGGDVGDLGVAEAGLAEDPHGRFHDRLAIDGTALLAHGATLAFDATIRGHETATANAVRRGRS